MCGQLQITARCAAYTRPTAEHEPALICTLSHHRPQVKAEIGNIEREQIDDQVSNLSQASCISCKSYLSYRAILARSAI